VTALSREARRLAASIHARFELTEAEEAILRTSLEAFDEMRRAQRDLVQFGPSVEGRDGR
jgi:hypothetical protein